MASINKTGLSYYTIDTDRYQDRRIKRLKKSFGCQGIAVYDYILCEIYRVQGCGSEWDEDTAFDVAEYFGLKETLVNEIVKYCGAVGLFDATLLSGGIITSAAIQRRYLEMCARAKRTNVVIPEKYKLPNLPEKTAILPEEMPILPEKTENPPNYSGSSPNTRVIKKEKKSKENKNTLSLTLSQPSESKEIDELLAQQRERIFEIFFFKNFIKPEQEVENFITHYAANGWRRSGGIAIKTAEQLLACAQQWQQKEKKARFDVDLLRRYKAFYDAAVGGGRWGREQLNTLLHGLVRLKWATLNQSRIEICGTRELCELLAPHVEKVAEKMGRNILIFENK
jgi:hypothetical protein